MQFDRETLASTSAVFLLRIDFYGKTLGVATYPTTYESQEYTGGLIDFVFEDKSQLLGVDLQANTFSTAVYLDGYNIAEEWRKGRSLEGLEATVSYVLSKNNELITNSETIILNGLIQQPVFADPEMHESFVSFSIERKPIDTGKPIILAEESIDTLKFPNMDQETAGGKFYPTVFGTPGVLRDGESTKHLFVTPAYNIKKYGL